MPDENKPETVITLKEFLENIPPGERRKVSDLIIYNNNTVSRYLILNVTDLWLYCPTQSTCEGMRQFRVLGEVAVKRKVPADKFLTCVCRNCSQSSKTFAVRFALDDDGMAGEIKKFG